MEERALDDEFKKTQQSDAGKNQEEKVPPLYIYDHLLVIPEQFKTTTVRSFALLCCERTKPDATNSGLGFSWKDVYKAVQIPQFQYAAIALDTQQNVAVKSKQEQAIHIHPVFEVPAGVGVLSTILSFSPFILMDHKSWKTWVMRWTLLLQHWLYSSWYKHSMIAQYFAIVNTVTCLFHILFFENNQNHLWRLSKLLHNS